MGRKRHSRTKATRSLPDALTYDEIDMLLPVIDNLEDLVAIRCMLFGGLRVAEVCDLEVRDVIYSQGALHVQEGKESKERLAPVDIHTLALIRSYVADRGLEPTDKLVAASVRTLQRHVKDYATRAGITRLVVSPHDLRHTCATWQLAKGIPLKSVMDNLGHEDIAYTERYLHLNIDQRSRSYREATRW